ncbi:MAG: DALR anticodon-binding domain-containing protein [Bacilli bacterium]
MNPDADYAAEAADLETEREVALARTPGASAVFELTPAELRPTSCTYLYELAGLFSSFYNADKVIVEDKAVMAKRLMLCARTLRILETGLKMLAIEPLEKM